LASFLLNIIEPGQLTTHYLRGNLFENLIIIEMLKNRFNQAKTANLYFYRDSNRNEVDCIIEDNPIKAVEIKSARTFTSGFVKGLKIFTKNPAVGDVKGFTIYGGEERFSYRDFEVLSWKYLSDLF
jgi:predicted AAA+ superfamily ATPase